jgi:hypothetical protein
VDIVDKLGTKAQAEAGEEQDAEPIEQ